MKKQSDGIKISVGGPMPIDGSSKGCAFSFTDEHKYKKGDIVRFKINSDESMSNADSNLFNLYKEHRFLHLTVRIGDDRTDLQNNTWSAMYKKAGQELGWGFLHARAHCKWYYGMPILRRDFVGFGKSFDKHFGHIDEEDCLRLMNSNRMFPVDGFPVTSNFGRKQGSEYIETIDRELDVYFGDILDESNKL